MKERLLEKELDLMVWPRFKWSTGVRKVRLLSELMN
jgi:hypothetical protein